MNGATFILLMILLTNLGMIVRARHRRIAAEAQLEIARCVSDVEERMLAGQIKMGEVCHDKMYERMISIQSAKKLGVRWNWWRKPSKEDYEIRTLVEVELKSGSELGKILSRYSLATLSQFRFQRPVVSVCFLVWLLVTGLSVVTALGACLAFIKSGLSLLNLGRVFTVYLDGQCATLAAGWQRYVSHAEQTYLWGYLRATGRTSHGSAAPAQP